MIYRICKRFEIESGHMLSKHAERCRFPHGHSRIIEIVIASESLDENEMVCDFKTIKLALSDFLDKLDHAMAINSDDPALSKLCEFSERILVFEGQDPTTEVLAKYVFDYLAGEMCRQRSYPTEHGEYRFRAGLTLERVRVWETSTSWAEYSGEMTNDE